MKFDYYDDYMPSNFINDFTSLSITINSIQFGIIALLALR